jgi:hypothetical protein
MPLFSAIIAASFGAQLTIASLLALFLGTLGLFVPDERAAQFGEFTKNLHQFRNPRYGNQYISSFIKNWTDTNHLWNRHKRAVLEEK